MSIEAHGGISTWENFWFVHQISLEILPAESSSDKAGGIGKLNYEFYLTRHLCDTSKVSLTFREILRHGANGFTSLPKEGVLRIFIASAGFEPVSLGLNGKYANHYTTEGK
jgi:hypothetical protein